MIEPHPHDLAPGDWIEVVVTHEVVIGREKSWIKLGVNASVQEGESRDQAIDRVANIVNGKVFEIIEGTVKLVEAYK